MKLKEFMIKERYTAALLARMSGVSAVAISAYLHGKVAFGKKRAKMISDAIKGKISVYDIMFPDVELKEMNKKKNRKKNEEKQQEHCENPKIIEIHG